MSIVVEGSLTLSQDSSDSEESCDSYPEDICGDTGAQFYALSSDLGIDDEEALEVFHDPLIIDSNVPTTKIDSSQNVTSSKFTDTVDVSFAGKSADPKPRSLIEIMGASVDNIIEGGTAFSVEDSNSLPKKNIASDVSYPPLTSEGWHSVCSYCRPSFI